MILELIGQALIIPLVALTLLLVPIVLIIGYPLSLLEKLPNTPFGKDVLLPFKLIIKKFRKTS